MKPLLLAGLILFGSQAHGADQGEQATLAGFDLSLSYENFRKAYKDTVKCEEKETRPDEPDVSVHFGMCLIRKGRSTIGYANFYRGKLFRLMMNAPKGVQTKTLVEQLSQKGAISYFKIEDPKSKGRRYACIEMYGRPCQTCMARVPFHGGDAVVTGITDVSDFDEVADILNFRFDAAPSPECSDISTLEEQGGTISFSNQEINAQFFGEVSRKRKAKDEAVDKDFKL